MSSNGYSLTTLIDQLKWLDKSQPGCVAQMVEVYSDSEANLIGRGEEKEIIQRIIQISIVCPPEELCGDHPGPRGQQRASRVPRPGGAVSQSRKGSFAEAAASTAIGFIVSWAVTPPILALFGYTAGTGEAFGITCIYTAISLARGYIVRRLFNYRATK